MQAQPVHHVQCTKAQELMAVVRREIRTTVAKGGPFPMHLVLPEGYYSPSDVLSVAASLRKGGYFVWTKEVLSSGQEPVTVLYWSPFKEKR